MPEEEKSFIAKASNLAQSLFSDDATATKPALPGDGPSWIKYVAMLTGILAAITGIIAVRSTRLTNDAIYESSLAVLAQAQASDAWSEYQADSIKARILETQIATSPALADDVRAKLDTDNEELRNRQPDLKKAAEQKTAERDSHLTDGRSRLAEKDMLEYAALAAQIGIAMASVAVMTKKHQAFGVAALAGVACIGLFAYAMIQHYLPLLF